MKKTLLTLLLAFALALFSACSDRPPESESSGGRLIVVGFSQVGAESDWRMEIRQSGFSFRKPSIISGSI